MIKLLAINFVFEIPSFNGTLNLAILEFGFFAKRLHQFTN